MSEYTLIKEGKEYPLISVIVPVYNILDCLERCVRSIIDQTYPNLEIILVDDGSTDGTGDLCDRLALLDNRIYVFHKENGGSSSARNLGIENSHGDYIAFVDSDDYISPEMYSTLYRGIQTSQCLIAQIGRDEIDPDGNYLPNICEPPESEILINSKDFLEELLMHRGDCSFCTKLVARKLFTDSDGNPRVFPIGILNEDFLLLIRMLPDTDGVYSMPGQLYHVYYRIGSNSRKADKETFSRVFGDCVDNADIVSKLVAEDYPELTDVALRFSVYQRLEYLLHIPVSQMTRDNVQYRNIVKWMRIHWAAGLCSNRLTAKNKIYHSLFAIAPKGIRVIHKKIKKL